MIRVLLTISGLLLTWILFPGGSWAQWQELHPSIIGGDLTARHGMGMVQIDGDKVLMFGGRETSAVKDTWLYDLSDNRWTKKAPIEIGGAIHTRAYMGVAPVGGDRVLMVGGWRAGSSYLTDTWLYDLSENKWTKLNPAIVGDGWSYRGFMSMAYLGGDKVILFGGYRYNHYYADTWIYDLSENSWTKVAPTVSGGSLSARYGMSLTYIADGKAIGFGGLYGGTFYDETWLFDLASNTWTLLSPDIVGGALQARRCPGLNFISGDKVLMFGGEVAGSYKGENDLWMFDLSDNKWTMIDSAGGPVPSARCFLGFTAIGPGRALLFGGDYNAYNNNFKDTWLLQIPDHVSSSLTAVPDIGNITVSWHQPSDVTDSTFYVYKNNTRISNAITDGTSNGETTVFIYIDEAVTSGTLNRYKILEVNSRMDSEVFSEEITVPYCD